jgi:hypothetical protein
MILCFSIQMICLSYTMCYNYVPFPLVWWMGTNVSGVPVTSICKVLGTCLMLLYHFYQCFSNFFTHILQLQYTLCTRTTITVHDVCVPLFTANSNSCYQGMGLLGCFVSW